MRLPRIAYAVACLGWSAASGCAGTSPPPAETGSRAVSAPTVSASTSGGCIQPFHKPLPAYGAEIPFTSPPRPTKKVAHVYPEVARQSGVEGTVKVAVLICEHGRVMATRVINSIPALEVAATDAVRRWEFKPAMVEGVPVAAWTTIPVKFPPR